MSTEQREPSSSVGPTQQQPVEQYAQEHRLSQTSLSDVESVVIKIHVPFDDDDNKPRKGRRSSTDDMKEHLRQQELIYQRQRRFVTLVLMSIIITVAIVMGTWIGVTNHHTKTESVAADVAAVSPPSSDIYIDPNTTNPIVPNSNSTTHANTTTGNNNNNNNSTKPTKVDTSHKKQWPELMETDGEIAKAVIKSERPDLKSIVILADDSFYTDDYDTSRVRIFVNSDGIVTAIPQIG